MRLGINIFFFAIEKDYENLRVKILLVALFSLNERFFRRLTFEEIRYCTIDFLISAFEVIQAIYLIE